MPVSKRLLFLLACLAVVLPGCDDENATIVNFDCGMIFADLRTDWTVDFQSSINTTVTACDNGGTHNGDPLSVSTAPVTYGDVLVTASNDSASFAVEGDLGAFSPAGPELVAAAEVDTCIVFFQVWEDDDDAYVHCIGRLDINTGLLPATCDSAAVDGNLDGVPEETCDLQTSLNVTVDIGP